MHARPSNLCRPGASLALALLCALSGQCLAMCGGYGLGAGAVHISPHSSSGPLIVREIAGQPVDLPQSGTGFRALAADTLLLLAECRHNEHLKFRFAFGTPPIHELQGTGSLERFGIVGAGQQWSPALLAIYTMLPAHGISPFVGIGFNYTFFRKERITNDTFRQSTFGPNAVTRVSLNPSWNPLLTAGAAFDLGSGWSIDAAWTYAPLKARATVTADNTPQGTVQVSGDLKNRTINTSITLHYAWGN